MSTPQEEEQPAKPVAQSASPEGETEAVHQGRARPADPQDTDDVMTRRLGGGDSAPDERASADAAVLAASRQRTRRAFIGLAAGAAAAYGFTGTSQMGPQTR